MDFFSYSDVSLGVVPQNGIGIDKTSISLASAPTENGFTFVGWSDGAKTYPAGASYTLQSGGNPILFTAVWTKVVAPVTQTLPGAPTSLSVLSESHSTTASFYSPDALTSAFICKLANQHGQLVHTTGTTVALGNGQYSCAFDKLAARSRYTVSVESVNQVGFSTAISKALMTKAVK
jgi:hypothetical protein